MRTACVALGVLLLLALSGCPVAEKREALTAVPIPLEGADPAHGIVYTYYSSPLFLLYYPRGWHFEEAANGVFVFTSPPEDEADEILEEFIVEIWVGEEATPEAFEEREKSLMAETDAVTKTEALQFKGRDAFLIQVEGTDAETGQAMHYKTVFFKKGKWVYRLHYAVEKSKLAEFEPVMEDMLEKFVVGAG